MRDYHINTFYSSEDEGYIADIPDLEHCSAFGETPEEALAEILLYSARAGSTTVNRGVQNTSKEVCVYRCFTVTPTK